MRSRFYEGNWSTNELERLIMRTVSSFRFYKEITTRTVHWFETREYAEWLNCQRKVQNYFNMEVQEKQSFSVWVNPLNSYLTFKKSWQGARLKEVYVSLGTINEDFLTAFFEDLNDFLKATGYEDTITEINFSVGISHDELPEEKWDVLVERLQTAFRRQLLLDSGSLGMESGHTSYLLEGERLF